MSFGADKQSSSGGSAPLTPEQVQAYYNQVDANTGGKLKTYAANGTPATPYQGVSRSDFVKPGTVATGDVTYQAPTAENVKALGGLGATRLAAIERERGLARGEVSADPSLSTYQKIRANQMTDEDLRSRFDAINKETEAAVSGMVSESAGRDLTAQTTNAGNKLQASETNADNSIRAQQSTLDALQADAVRRYQAKAANARLKREDLEALANIFFGGKGNVQSNTSKGSGFNIGLW